MPALGKVVDPIVEVWRWREAPKSQLGRMADGAAAMFSAEARTVSWDWARVYGNAGDKQVHTIVFNGPRDAAGAAAEALRSFLRAGDGTQYRYIRP